MITSHKQNQLLLFKRAQTGIRPHPGGYMDNGENLEQTAIREPDEKTSIAYSS